jgi:hypothetical protein
LIENWRPAGLKFSSKNLRPAGLKFSEENLRVAELKTKFRTCVLKKYFIPKKLCLNRAQVFGRKLEPYGP